MRSLRVCPVTVGSVDVPPRRGQGQKQSLTRLPGNLFARSLHAVPVAPDWRKLVADPSLPLHLDLGCGYGELVQSLGALDTSRNFVGVDLNPALLRERERNAENGGPAGANVAFWSANVRHASFADALLATYPGPLVTVSCIFPNPVIHTPSRRLLQRDIVNALWRVMPLGAEFVTVTENPELADEMYAFFEGRGWSTQGTGRWAPSSPFNARSAWETTVTYRQQFDAKAWPPLWAHWRRGEARRE